MKKKRKKVLCYKVKKCIFVVVGLSFWPSQLLFIIIKCKAYVTVPDFFLWKCKRRYIPGYDQSAASPNAKLLVTNKKTIANLNTSILLDDVAPSETSSIRFIVYKQSLSAINSSTGYSRCHHYNWIEWGQLRLVYSRWVDYFLELDL